MAADPTFFLVGKLSGGPDAHIIELSGYLSAYSPYIFYGEERQRLVSPFIRVDEAAALKPLYFLANLEPIFANVFVSAMPTDIGIPTARSTSADILEP